MRPYILACLVSIVATASSSPTAISVPPSSNLYGIDGQWRTFELQVGTPSQTVQVLIAIGASQIVTVIPQGCTAQSPYQQCVTSRGGVFSTNSSTSYREIGTYLFTADDSLNLTSSAQFGFDTVSLGPPASPSFTIANTTIGSTALYTYYVGYFGLRPQDTLYTAEEPSIISQLKSASLIPSLSFGYTTGARYANRAASLTLGGYDSGLLRSNGVSFPISADRPFTVQINHINTTAQSQSLSSQNITAAIDSSVTEWYLPQSVCDQFASAFGLTYDNTTELYFVSDQAYNALNATRPNITISISPSTSNSSSVDLVFPWAAFDLTALYPYQGLTGQQRFFPIRRASSADQYTLGRAFLQEAYISADWERNIFNVSQCGTQSGTISTISSSGASSSNDSASSGLSGGAIAGIVVGVIVGVLLVAALIAFLIIRRRRQRTAEAVAAGKAASESDDNAVFPKAELDASADPTFAYEKRAPGGELDSMPHASQVQRAEAPNSQLEVFEMPGDTPKRAEMPTPSQLQATEKEARIEREKLYNGVPQHAPGQTPSSSPNSPHGTGQFPSNVSMQRDI